MVNEELIKKGSFLSPEEAAVENKKRKNEKLFMSLKKGDSIPSGWEILKEMKTKIHLVKNKTTGKHLEDKVWCMFYEMGIRQLSSNHFTIETREKNIVGEPRQLDVVAVDGEVAFVVECKWKKVLGKKEIFGKEIADIALYKKNAAEAIKKAVGKNKLHVVFVVATENIIIEENDKLRAEENNILIWNEYDLLAFQELADIAGEGAKYQIYNRIFLNKKIKNFDMKVPALKSKMGGYTYYLFSMRPEHLLKIAYVHHRSGNSSFMDISDSYQRIIDSKRVSDITSYIEEGGFFPGSIIVNFNKKLLKEDLLGDKSKALNGVENCAKPVIITLPPYYGSAWIIDGQHRLYGYADSELKNFETVPVVAFVTESNKMQTKIFVDINREQQAIKANLLYDLYEDLYFDSDDDKEKELWTISKIVKELNKRDDSPFKGNITIPQERNNGNITLQTMFLSLKQLRLVSKKEKILFLDDKNDTVKYAADRLIVFYDIIRSDMKEEWDKGDKHFFRTNAGVAVFNGIFRDAVGRMENSQLNDLKKFRNYMSKILNVLLLQFLDYDQETIDSYRSGGAAGQSVRDVRATLTELIQNKEGFYSEWFENMKKTKESRKMKVKKLSDLLNDDESESLEFKGSVKLCMEEYAKNKKRITSDGVKEEILKTVASFLNAKGGVLVIGILEKHRFEKVLDNHEDWISLEKNIIAGIDLEYKKDGWDGYYRTLCDIVSKIDDLLISNEMVKIRKEVYKNKDICVVEVLPSCGDKYYLNDGNDFYVRSGPGKKKLKPEQIEKYWKNRL